MFFKKIAVPSVIVDVEALVLWEVRWQSRNGPYSSNLQPELETFTSEEEAARFKQALEDAFRLIKHTSGNEVTLKKAQKK